MQNKEAWQPTKFVPTKKGYRASRDRNELYIGSRFLADIQAQVYERALREHASGVLLDLGCGKVPLYGIYGPLVTDNVCVDWGHSLHKNPYLDHEFDLNQPIPLDDAQFDTILLTDVLEHIARPERLFGEIARLLKPGGTLILTVPFLYWLHEEPHDYFRYTEHKLRSFCEDHGFEVVSLEPYGGALEALVDLTAKLLSFSRALSAVHLAFSKLIVGSIVGRKMYQYTARKFPIGYCLIARKQPTESTHGKPHRSLEAAYEED